MYVYIYIYFFFVFDFISCYVLELSLFHIFSYIIHIVGISFIYVEHVYTGGVSNFFSNTGSLSVLFSNAGCLSDFFQIPGVYQISFKYRGFIGFFANTGGLSDFTLTFGGLSLDIPRYSKINPRNREKNPINPQYFGPQIFVCTLLGPVLMARSCFGALRLAAARPTHNTGS